VAEFDITASPLRVDGLEAVPKPLLVEAGAGAGKTWALAHLAVRFMIEDGVEPDEVLLVTFTRDAARELRGRVREHLTEVIGLLATGAPAEDTPWREARVRWGDEAARDRDLRRARHCRATLDGLHARTIHSFAAVNVVTTAGALSDDGRLWRQAVNETLSRWALERPQWLADVHDLATVEAVADALYQAGVRGAPAPTVRVVPEARATSEAASEADQRAGDQRDLALAIVERFVEHLNQSGRSTFADLMVALAGRLERRDAQLFRDELRATFRVVMIDEFQDTDPLQWHVFRELFLDADSTRLVLVGDPKQAIYGFRSGGVETFLEVRDYCRSHAIAVATLRSNFRSTPQLVDAVNRVFAGADFHYAVGEPPAEPVIGFSPAVAVREDVERRLTRVGARDASLHLRTAAYSKGNEEEVLRGVAAYVRRARDAGYAYSDVAVICAWNSQCASVHRHLSRERIASVTSSGERIYACAAANQLRLLLVALESPDDVALTEALRATWFRGRRAADPASSEVGRCVAQLVTRFLRTRAVEEVVLATRDGERNLTDLHHLGELMSRECDGMRAVALVVDWLESAATTLDADEGETTRRLETESDAVRVLTVHRAKGQEFPVVLLPFVGEPYREVKAGRSALQRWVEGGVTVIDAGSGVAWGDEAEVVARRLRTEAAQAGEKRRLLYVALTRARDAAVLWCPLPYRTPFSGELTRLLFDRQDGPGGSIVRNRPIGDVRDLFVGSSPALQRDRHFAAVRKDPVEVLRATFDAAAAIEVLGLAGDVGRLVEDDVSPDAPAPVAFVAGVAPHHDYERRRWSYSAVAAEMRAIGAAEGDDAPGLDETGSQPEEAPGDDRVRLDVAEVFGSLAGTGLGVLVHQALESAVGRGGDAAGEIERVLARGAGRLGAGADDLALAIASLRAVLSRPLRPTLDGRALVELERGDVATEMRFTLSLGGRASPARLAAAVAAVAELDRSGADGRSLFAQYFDSEHTLEGQLSDGFLVGSLDLTVRGADGRYRIVDYKTDQLAGAQRPYAPARLRRHMEAAHYPLQALFYSVALHRHLRSRLAGYDPAVHLAGVDYLFVRVVGDASAHDDDGIFSWPVSPAAVAAASDLLGGDSGA
jgi:exodeoxyribonuclease V beta subunit